MKRFNSKYRIIVLWVAMAMATSSIASAQRRTGGGGGGGASRPAPAPSRPAPAPSRPAPSRPVQQQPSRPVQQQPSRPVQQQPSRPVQQQPSRPVQQQPGRPVTPTQPVHPGGGPVTAKPQPKPGQPAKPVEPVKPVEPTKPVQPVKPVEPTKPTKPIANNPVKPAPGSVKKPISVDPAKAPKPGQKLTPPKQIVQHKGPAELDNKRSVANFSRSKTNMNIVRNNVQINKVINVRQTDFSNRHYGDIRDRGGRYGGYYRDFGWHNYYHGFWGYGFFGGFYYPFRPCFGIADYFFYPALYWLYVDAIEDSFYLAWYPNYYYGHPISVFPYVGVWYPTEEFVDMGVEVSAQPDIAQDNFRQGMTLLTQALTQQIANNLDASVTLGTNEIVVTHYQNLQDTAYAMDGFVDSPSLNLHVAFKALVDMSDPSKSMVFVPTGAEPTPADNGILNMINQRIIALGGDPMIADVETDVASSQ